MCQKRTSYERAGDNILETEVQGDLFELFELEWRIVFPDADIFLSGLEILA